MREFSGACDGVFCLFDGVVDDYLVMCDLQALSIVIAEYHVFKFVVFLFHALQLAGEVGEGGNTGVYASIHGLLLLHEELHARITEFPLFLELVDQGIVRMIPTTYTLTTTYGSV